MVAGGEGTQKLLNLGMPEDGDLFIRQCPLPPIRVVSKPIIIWDYYLRRRRWREKLGAEVGVVGL